MGEGYIQFHYYISTASTLLKGVGGLVADGESHSVTGCGGEDTILVLIEYNKIK